MKNLILKKYIKLGNKDEMGNLTIYKNLHKLNLHKLKNAN